MEVDVLQTQHYQGVFDFVHPMCRVIRQVQINMKLPSWVPLVQRRPGTTSKPENVFQEAKGGGV